MEIISTPRGETATHAQIAALEFKGVKKFRAMTQEKRIKRMREAYDEIYSMSVIAAEIVSHDKPKLVKTVREKYDEFGPFLMMLAHAHERVREISELIGSAEARLASALAVIEPDPDARK